jgi:hypothetical protein
MIFKVHTYQKQLLGLPIVCAVLEIGHLVLAQQAPGQTARDAMMKGGVEGS